VQREENEQWLSGSIGFKFNGVQVEFGVTIPAAPVKPQRILPIVQDLANFFVSEAERSEAANGRAVSCKAGCGACCRQAVPISEAEVYRIAEIVEGLEEPRRSEVKRRFRAAAEHFNSTGWYDRFADHIRRAPELTIQEGYPEGVALIREYFTAGVPCPFLENESCSIHPDRPVACREYLVTSPAENCSRFDPAGIRRVELGLKPSKALSKLGADAAGDEIGPLILSRALEIAGRFPDRFEERPGPEWLKEFLDEALDNKEPAAERYETAADHA
jgi:Fe-S-cluster containining protein